MVFVDMSKIHPAILKSRHPPHDALLHEYMNFSLGMYILLLRHICVQKIIFRGACSFSVRASDVCAVRCLDDQDIRAGVEVECQQWSLTTYMSALPHHVIEDTMRKNQRGDYAQYDFFNIFVNRLVMLWYESVMRISPALAMRSDYVMLDNVVSHISVGRAQTLSSIKSAIKNLTGAIVDINEYVGEWRAHSLNKGLGMMRLSVDCILGENVWLQDANVLIAAPYEALAGVRMVLDDILPERLGYCVHCIDFPALGESFLLGKDSLESAIYYSDDARYSVLY